jgi:hypothetical protein
MAMKKEIHSLSLILLPIAAASLCLAAPARSLPSEIGLQPALGAAPPIPELSMQGSTPSDAVPIGVACTAGIVIGEGYVTRTESLEARITMLEVVRGQKAWEMVKGASPSNKPPEAGLEYVAARIRFEFGAKGAAGNQTYGVRDEQFASVSESGKQYERPSVVQPKPELSGRLYPGDSLEGWLAFFVSIDDKKPLMSFGNNYRRVWFRLY